MSRFYHETIAAGGSSYGELTVAEAGNWACVIS